jgi:hypothetical protein
VFVQTDAVSGNAVAAYTRAADGTLHPGDTFPELTLTVPGGQTVTVPEAFAGQFGVLLARPDLPRRVRCRRE